MLWPGLGCRPGSPHQSGADRTPVSHLKFSREHLREPWRSGHSVLALLHSLLVMGRCCLEDVFPFLPSLLEAQPLPTAWSLTFGVWPPASSTLARTLEPAQSLSLLEGLPRAQGVKAVR